MSDDAQAQARALLAQLTEDAKKGAIIPFRLPGQLEEILAAMDRANEAGAASSNSGGGDMEGFKKDFADILSHGFHDLRLPLTSIRGYSDMLGTPGMGELSAMQQQFLATVRVNARRLESLMMDMSDLSKIYLGTLKITAKMDMFKNISMMLEKANRSLADELGRTLTFDVPSGLPILNVDAEILAKALNKLIENAIRYAAPEGGQVNVAASADGSMLKIVIQDNGIGMTPEELGKLGTPYFRSDNEIVLAFKGSGLGIPIAYNIIQLLGGTVDVVSEPGQGSLFTVSLPGMS
ncbi:MAG: HAMP domain-containing sensor histidine kinase [Chloroflexota bacterium]